ncbi:DNA-binding transcriptional regulator, IclR family [Halomicrobium zhouii]|uniref:DNA-binding transcriptional regulator, IclR family n=1 Tax=Halomicrobium zhouii TaxID=767519 RepID=A0A1I6L0V0_9EURY|nr:ArsR family transcriptional regulator [Halomicrobium zhouii]SFR97085.1 DNA-binding transcriptional regulator, IclR family [Halomicrobium zhouii]
MPSNRVMATETAVEILESLANLESAGVTELADAVDGSKGNVHKHLKTLEAANFVCERNGRYELGLRFLEFATAAKWNERIYRVSRHPVAQLANNTGTTATLVVPEGFDGVYLHTASQSGKAAKKPVEGRRAPLDELTTGLAILSQYSPDRQEEAMSALSLADAEAMDLRDQLDRIQQRGIVVQSDDSEMAAMAAPITVEDGRPVGAIGLWQRESDGGNKRVESDFEKLVRNAAGTVSNRLSLSE